MREKFMSYLRQFIFYALATAMLSRGINLTFVGEYRCALRGYNPILWIISAFLLFFYTFYRFEKNSNYGSNICMAVLIFRNVWASFFVGALIAIFAIHWFEDAYHPYC
jgi:hypothetical protein